MKAETGSLRDFGVNYKQVDLKKDGTIDFEAAQRRRSRQMLRRLFSSVQRATTGRQTLSCAAIGEAISFIKSIKSDAVCIVDNCYGEFAERTEPTQHGADLIVGSLIKNPGGGLAQSGGYIAGKKKYVELAAYRQTAPGLGAERRNARSEQVYVSGIFHRTARCCAGA